MKSPYFLHALACGAALSGCASIEPVLPATSPPQKESCYIAGSFTRTNSGGFAFIVVNTSTGIEYGMSLGADSTLPQDVTDQVVVIKVPPGRYTVSHWITYGTLTKQRSRKIPISNEHLAAPFSIAAGSVTYLGSYSIDTHYTAGYVNWSIRPTPIVSREAREKLLKTYPLFGESSFSCRLCSDSVSSPPPKGE